MTAMGDLSRRFVSELTRILGALLETNASSRPADPRVDTGFVATVATSDAARGSLRVFFGRIGAEALAKKLAASVTPPPEEAVLDRLKDLCAQTASALVDQDSSQDALVVSSVVAVPAPDATATAMDVVMAGHEEVLHISFTGDLQLADAAIPADRERSARGRTLDVILDIDLPLVVRFGRTDLPLKEITALAPGSVIDLGRSPEEPVDVLISNQVVARGEVVVVAGNYGVRIRDVISPAERARSLEMELT